jgi:chromosome partitioning protein
MSKIITIAQQKGGAGKTTIAAHIALALAQTGRSVAIIDIDPQGSLTNWHKIREKKFGVGFTGLSFNSSQGWRIETAISNLKNKFDFVVIDSPPHTETESKSAIRVADMVIIPMQPSPTDLWATESTINFANSEGKLARVLLNRFNPLSKINKEILAQIPGVKFKNYIGNRVAFSTCFLNGLTVLETQPTSQAAIEVKAVIKEMLNQLESRTKKENKVSQEA